MMNGDVLTALDYAHLVDVHRESGNALTIASHRRVVRTEYGVIHLDGNAGETRVVTGFEEKPELPYIVSMGVYVLEPEALEHIEANQRLDLPDLVQRLLEANVQVGAYVYDGYWLDIGRHEDYEKAILEFEQVKPLLMNEKTANEPPATASLEPARGWPRPGQPGRSMTVTVTGGAGYVGALVVDELLSSGREVRVLDVLLHGQEDVAGDLTDRGVELIRGDIRDADARRRALEGAEAVVHLAAIVGDPACARDPELSNDVNVEGSRRSGAGRPRARRRAPRLRLDLLQLRADGRSRPFRSTRTASCGPCRSTPSRRWASRRRCSSPANGNGHGLRPTCLRFATVYGVGDRMRFDLTVNEFTRDLWADKHLEVFGERFWRPYIHVRDAARAVRTVLDAPADEGGRQGVQRRPLRRELPQARPRGDHHREARQGRRGVRVPRRGPARLQGLVREDPRRARLRAASTACPTASRRSWARSRSSASATPTTARYRN